MDTAVNTSFHAAETLRGAPEWSEQLKQGMCYRLALRNILFFTLAYSPLNLVMLNMESCQAVSNIPVGAYAAQCCISA